MQLETKQHQCPTCKGKKELPALLNKGENIARHAAGNVPCITCKGSGTVDADLRRRVFEGEEFTRSRKERGESLYACAKRLGISSSQLSAYESGLLVSEEVLVQIQPWRKPQTTALIVVQCAKDQVEELKAVIRAAGGTIANASTNASISKRLRKSSHGKFLTALEHFKQFAEEAPEGCCNQAKALNEVIGNACDDLMRELRELGFKASAADLAFELEAAMYDYARKSNPEATVFPTAEGFGSVTRPSDRFFFYAEQQTWADFEKPGGEGIAHRVGESE